MWTEEPADALSSSTLCCEGVKDDSRIHEDASPSQRSEAGSCPIPICEQVVSIDLL